MSIKKTVLITGAESGIGRAMAIEGARRGYAQILTGRTVANLDATRDMIGAVARDVLPSLEAAQGRVVNVGSVFGDIAYPFFAAYSATKFGLRGFSDTLRRELSGRGVGVTYIAPRETQTAAEAEFAALIEPMDMTMDTPARVATQAWDAIEAGKRESFPPGKERLFVKIQRLFPSVIDKAVGAQARDPKTLRALETVSKA